MKNYEKLFDATAYLLYLNNKTMNYTVLIKELYFADRESLKKTRFSITGDTYYSMRQGPVLSTLYDLIKGTCKQKDYQEKWNELFVKKGYCISIIKDNYNRKSLSRNEQKILESYSNMFKGMDWKEVVDKYAHNSDFCPEWEKVYLNRRKPLTLERILTSSGFSKEETKIAVEENNYYATC